MDRDRFEVYWSYYLSIEKMIEDTRQYVSPSYANRKTYSDEFTKIILLSCSEIDSLLKSLCRINKIKASGKYYKMEDYVKLLNNIEKLDNIGFAPIYNSSLNEQPIVVYPFAGLNDQERYANLEWWKSYQAIKHERIENVELGNLENAVYSLTAHYIIICFAMKCLHESSGKEYVIKNYKSNYLIPCV